MSRERSEHNEIVEKWMLTTYQNGGIERFDHLHIDKIDETWGAQPLWINGGLEAFRIAVRLRNLHKLPLDIQLAFSLNSGEERAGIDFTTKEEFTARLDQSPPSLYLVHVGSGPKPDTEKAVEEGHVYNDASVEELDLELFGEQGPRQRCFYVEFRRKEEAEYCRSVFL